MVGACLLIKKPTKTEIGESIFFVAASLYVNFMVHYSVIFDSAVWYPCVTVAWTQTHKGDLSDR